MSNDRPTRVWFVGAGFSAGLGYPVGQQLLSHLIRYLQGTFSLHGRTYRFKNTAKKVENAAEAARIVVTIANFLRTYFDTELARAHEVNVSEFFTVAHALADTPALFGSGPARKPSGRNAANARAGEEPALYHRLAAATRSFFLDITRTAETKDQPADFREVVKLFQPCRDAIVSFNWDEELDYSLTTMSKSSDIAFNLRDWSAKDGFLVLKPHGSIGWYDVVQGIHNDDAYFIAANDDRVERAKRRIIGYLELDPPLDIDGQKHPAFSCAPLIMPPTFAKRFEYPEQQNVWRDVLEVCRGAREFVLLGYSLPPDDFLTRAALRSALSGTSFTNLRCLIVGKTCDALANAQTVFREGLSRRRNFLEFTFGSDDGPPADFCS